MRISDDAAKHVRTLVERGLDCERCDAIFDGTEETREDRTQDYGERRWVTIGRLDGRMVIDVWTERDGARRIISLRKANEREKARYGGKLRSSDVY